jgi:prevent-host-death family protein
MPDIRPVSDLRNYNEVLKDIAIGEPVFLTKNGRGRYAIIDMAEYEKYKATIKLLSQLSEAEKAVKNEEDWLSSDEVKNSLGV